MKPKRYTYKSFPNRLVPDDENGEFVKYDDWKEMSDYADELVKHKDMVCLPADLRNLRETNEHFAIENHRLREKIRELEIALRESRRTDSAGDVFQPHTYAKAGEPIQCIHAAQNVGHSIVNPVNSKKS